MVARRFLARGERESTLWAIGFLARGAAALPPDEYSNTRIWSLACLPPAWGSRLICLLQHTLLHLSQCWRSPQPRAMAKKTKSKAPAKKPSAAKAKKPSAGSSGSVVEVEACKS